MGVSMLLLLLLKEPPLLLLLGLLLWLGGCGLAKGFGGPWAPALRMALALGEGGGRTTPEEWEASVLALAGVSDAVPPDSRGEDSAVAEPPSDCSLGIWTLRRGLLAPIWAALLPRGGGWISDGREFRCGMVDAFRGGEVISEGGLLRGCMALTSTDCDRFSFSIFTSRLSLLLPKPQC